MTSEILSSTERLPKLNPGALGFCITSEEASTKQLVSSQVTCLLQVLAGLEFQVENSRHTSAGPSYAGHGKWGVYVAVETCVLH